jgi:putative phage-type endonuclease
MDENNNNDILAPVSNAEPAMLVEPAALVSAVAKPVDTLVNTLADLVNIIDSFTVPPKNEFVFSEKDEMEFFESACLLIEELIRRNPMAYIQPNFHESIVDEVFEMLIQVFDENSSIIEDEYDDEEDIADKYDELEELIKTIIDNAMHLFYKHIAPCRSHSTSFIRKTKPNIDKLEKQINYLKSVPQPEQRTDEWYAFRYKYLTASNIWKAFSSQSTKNQLIYEKCKPLFSSDLAAAPAPPQMVNTESPMHWGNKYESVSVALYERMYKTTVSEFGCIPHKSIAFLAASPDGINTDKTSGRYGRMLEVKNIVNREINGIPKLEYWVQMQLQLEVCDLKECDFLETRFTEYENEEEFMKDSFTPETPFMSADICLHEEESAADEKNANANAKKNKGIIAYFLKEGQPFYEYYTPEKDSTLEMYQIWEENTMTQYAALTWVKNIYWKLDQLSCVLVMRNKFWFEYAKQDLYAIWSIIEKERKEGYAHRAPTKRVVSAAAAKSKYKANEPDLLQTKICYIKM